ncbi:MAG: hypothetical protein J5687_08595 [Treponema sp.]|nr:hypothetical protein [Treponema sp.]
MKKILLLFILSCASTTLLFSLDIIQQFENTIVPFTDISIERLWAAQKDDSSMEDFSYQQEIWKKENEYKKTLSNSILQDKCFTGYWYLTDINGKIVAEEKRAPIQFILYPKGISYEYLSSHSYVYEIENNSYIIIPTWDAGMIRMLKIFDDKMYIYNLDGDTWYLDDIHKTGNYYKKQ